MVIVMAVSISSIWRFVAFINILLLIWVIFCDEFPFSTFLCCLTNTRLLVGSLARCHWKFLHPVFIPLKIAIMEVWGSLSVFWELSIAAVFWVAWSMLVKSVGYLGICKGEKGFEYIWSPVAVQKHLGIF